MTITIDFRETTRCNVPIDTQALELLGAKVPAHLTLDVRRDVMQMLDWLN